MNKERLLRLADKLEGVGSYNHPIPDNKFDLRSWIDHHDNELDWRCGTTACAVGWACLDPWFNKQGLIFAEDMSTPIYNEIHDVWTAVRIFFDIEGMESLHLFSPEYYLYGQRSPRHVAKRIREFVELGRCGI